MIESDRAYFRKREVEEQRCAERAPDTASAAIHRMMQTRYHALAAEAPGRLTS